MLGIRFRPPFCGSPGDGSLGGVGLLLSPPALQSWRVASSRVKTWRQGRLLHATFNLGGFEGIWHIASVDGPTMQSSASDKQEFLDSLTAPEVVVMKLPTEY